MYVSESSRDIDIRGLEFSLLQSRNADRKKTIILIRVYIFPQFRYMHISFCAVIIYAQNFVILFFLSIIVLIILSLISRGRNLFLFREHDFTAFYRGTPRSNALLRKLTAAAILKRSARRPPLYACIFIVRRSTIIILTMSRCILKRAHFSLYDEIISRNVHVIDENGIVRGRNGNVEQQSLFVPAAQKF